MLEVPIFNFLYNLCSIRISFAPTNKGTYYAKTRYALKTVCKSNVKCSSRLSNAKPSRKIYTQFCKNLLNHIS